MARKASRKQFQRHPKPTRARFQRVKSGLRDDIPEMFRVIPREGMVQTHREIEQWQKKETLSSMSITTLSKSASSNDLQEVTVSGDVIPVSEQYILE